MIKVTRFNREPIYVNADLVEYVETTPDTVISLTTGEKFMVLETPDQVVDLVVEYEKRIRMPLAAKSDVMRLAEALQEDRVTQEERAVLEEADGPERYLRHGQD